MVNTAASPLDPPHHYVSEVKEFFDQQYLAHPRYWWRGENRYSIEPEAHTPFHAELLRAAAQKAPGRALDLGAGEGADAIRLAKLGYMVDAVELSAVACRKIEEFAQAEQVSVHVRNESMLDADLEPGAYDLVLLSGSLHYARDKHSMLARADAASASGAVHALAVFSTASPLPEPHTVVPVFPDDEGGVIEQFYRNWDIRLLAYERDRPERSHPGFPAHVHSYIKLIAQRPEENG